MRNLRWQILIAIGGLILVIGLLVGQTPELESITPQPVPGGVHVEAVLGEVSRLNPVLDLYSQTDRDINRLIYSGLVRFDDRGAPRPDLATWTVSADATLYTFTLREEATWHDGEPVTADDVVYTYSKLQDPDYPGPPDLHETWRQINIIRLDEHVVQFQLPEPFAPFLDYVSVGLLPDHLLRGVSIGDLIDHPYNLQPIGTGPFRFESFLTEDERIIGVNLVAFQQYYAERPFLERVEFRLYDEPEAALEDYLAGEIQAISQVTPDILDTVLDLPNLNLHSSRTPDLSLVFLNTQHPEKTFLADKRFRQALVLAVNRQWIINQVLGGQGVMPVGPIPPGNWAHDDNLVSLPFDPDRAGAMLDELGWELPAGATIGEPEYVRTQEEVELTLELLHPDEPESTKVAELLRLSWESLGVRVSLVAVPATDLLEEHLQPRAYEAALTEIHFSRYPDPDPYPFWHDSQAEAGQNYSGLSDRNISIWLEQARITPDFTRRADLYRSFQFRFIDQAPAVLLFYRVHNYAIDDSVRGVSVGPFLDPSDRFNGITAWHLLARRSLTTAETPSPLP
jgi:peptide/nickel transport system substrate-binding protein